MAAAPEVIPAPPAAVQEAKAAPAAIIDPVAPPPPAPEQPESFTAAVQNVITNVTNETTNVNVVKVNNTVVVKPQVWNYVDYDSYRRPILYNPIAEALTFNYFYGGLYQVFVPAGGRVVLNVSVNGVFPFTACGKRYVTVGSFYGGGLDSSGGLGRPAPAELSAATSAGGLPHGEGLRARCPAHGGGQEGHHGRPRHHPPGRSAGYAS